MGKKRIVESPNASKKETDNLFKVLRPKVYIIDSSHFKSLVQELTGNGRSISSPFPSNPKAVVNVEDPETSIGGSTSLDSPIDSFEFYNQLSIAEEMNQPYNYQTNFHDTASDNSLSQLSQPVDTLACQDLATLLLSDTEQNTFFDGYNYHQYHQEEVSICDYEISGLIY